MPDKIMLEKITLLRLGDTTSYPLVTLKPEWIKEQPRISFACEDLAGEVISPQLQFSVFLDCLPELLSEDRGGILHDYNASTEDIFIQIYLSDDPGNPAWLGNITHWIWSQGDQALVIGAVGGLETLRRFRLQDIFSSDESELISRPAKWLVNRIYGNNDLSLLFPLVYDDYRISYANHPETRFVEGHELAPPTPQSHVYAITTDGTKLYMAVERDLLSYDIATHEWAFIRAITDPELLSFPGLSYRVMAIHYEDTPSPQLRLLIGYVPTGLTQGTPPPGYPPGGPSFMNKCYEMVFTL